MSEPTPDKRPLSEIGHLFLTSLRERQTTSAPRPQRLGPNMTPDADIDSNDPANSSLPPIVPPLPIEPSDNPPTATILLGGNLDGAPSCDGRYAAHLARQGRRVGLIEIDGPALRVTVFEPRSGEEMSALPESRRWTAAGVSESLEELSWDVPCWLVVPDSGRGGRAAESRTLLAAAPHWTILTNGERDAIVSAYRALKGAADPVMRSQARMPTVSLALLDGTGETADRIYDKLASVCRQFLGINIVREPPVAPDGDDVIAHIALECPPATAEPATPWESIIADFIRSLDRTAAATPALLPAIPAQPPTPAPTIQPAPPVHNQSAAISAAPLDDDLPTEVIDLPPGASTAEIVRASIAGAKELAACPIQVPMCPSASVAVARDRRLVLVAAAQAPLTDLRAIAGALRWLADSRALVAMALPQLSIDLDRLPALRLLIDRRDLGAQSLDPLIHSDRVTVHTYRRLTWSGKTGLLLDAA
jgi:hypothetical protein